MSSKISWVGPLLGATLALAAISPARADDERYGVKASASEIEVGSQGEAKLAIIAADGWHLPGDYPAEMTFRPQVSDDVLAVAKKRYQREDGERADDGKSLAWTVSMVGHREGAHVVDIHLKFQVCAVEGRERATERECHVQEAELSMKIPVKG